MVNGPSPLLTRVSDSPSVQQEGHTDPKENYFSFGKYLSPELQGAQDQSAGDMKR